MATLKTIEGIGPAYAEKLKEAGIRGVNSLLNAGATKKGRTEIAKKSDISEKLILEWVNHCDLFRLTGVGGEYADLLEEAGVDSIPELAKRKADALHKKLTETNLEKKLVRSLPSLERVEGWIEEAKSLPRVVEH